MASTYGNDLRLEEIGDGEQSGTWGATTNTNLELISEALSFGTEGITTNANTHTTTIADGASDPGRSLYLKYTGTLDSACTITIAPNSISKTWYIENGTSGSQSIIISQGSGANVTIPTGQTKIVYSNGAGSGAAMAEIGTLGVSNISTGFVNTTASDVTSGVTKVMVETGNDNFIRHGDAGSVRAFLNVANGATNVTNNNQITNGAGYTTAVGDITGVTAGTNLNGGGSSGAVTLNLDSTITVTTVNAGTVNTTSDERAKKDITPITGALNKVQQLGGYSFTLKETDEKSSGVIAQEVQKVMPELVQEGAEGLLSVQYGNMVGLLIEAIKEQQTQIDELKQKLNG